MPLRPWATLLVTWLLLAVFFGISLMEQLDRHPLGPVEATSIYLCLLLLVGLFLLPGFEAPRTTLAADTRGPSRATACLALFLIPYLVYAWGTGDFQWISLGKLLAIAAVPLALYSLRDVRDPSRLDWMDLVALPWIAAPVLSGMIGGIWNTPVPLDFMARIYVVSVGAWAFVIWRGTTKVGYDFRLSAATLRDGLVNFAAFAAIALPLGFLLHFIAWNPDWNGPWDFAFGFLTIFIFIAMPEELFFRGLVQNLLEGSWGSRYGAQAVASLLFGLTHVLHAPFPNWRYVILASIAGWFYGSAYRRTRSLMASGIAHALVDNVWTTWFLP